MCRDRLDCRHMLRRRWSHRRPGAVMRARGQPHCAADEHRNDDQCREHDERRMADAERHAALSARGQRPQHARDLAGGAPGAGRLDRQHVLEVRDQLGVVGVPVLLTLGRRGVDDGGERSRDLGSLGLDVRQFLAHVLHRHGDLAVAFERDLAREHLVQHHSERVQVGLPVDMLSQRLLGRHVVGGAEHPAVGGQALLVERAGDPEIRHLGRALLVDQDVLGLDVAVDDVASVRGAERAGDLDRIGHRLGHRQPSLAADPILERLALHVLEHDVGPALVLAGIDHAHDVRMRELGNGPGLAAEALELFGGAGHLAVHQLDRDLALERLVECAIDRRHTAGPDPGLEPVAPAQRRSEQSAHRLSLFCGNPPSARSTSKTAELPSRETDQGRLRDCHPAQALGRDHGLPA